MGKHEPRYISHMRILLVSVALEFPLANYCLATQIEKELIATAPQIDLIHLDTFKLRDYNSKNTEIWKYIARLEELKPDIVTFSVYLWNNLIIRELVSITAKVFPHIRIILGGPEMATEKAAEPWFRLGGIHAVVRGEGEITFTEIIRRTEKSESLFGLAGCSWWDGDTVIHEQTRPATHDLSNFPSPYLTGWIPVEMFDRHDAEGRLIPGRFGRAFLETYRGCYMQCSYCQWGNGTKLRSAFPLDRVLSELSWLLSQRITRLWIVDAMFGYKKEQAKHILRHIISEKSHYKVSTSIVCYHNQDFYDEELFELYREAGVSVEVDLQSTNLTVLTDIGRQKWYKDSFQRHLKAFQKHGVPTTGGADLIIGLPHDNEESFAESVNFLLERGMHINLYQTSIIPDTPMSRSIALNGIVASDIAPRAVFSNRTFPVDQMLRARLIGHGVDFFRRHPRTASLLWRSRYTRPVDLCRDIGDYLWREHGLMYGESHILDAVLSDKQKIIEEMVSVMWQDKSTRSVVLDLLTFEANAAALCFPPRGETRTVLQRSQYPPPEGDHWLMSRPLFNGGDVVQSVLSHDLSPLLDHWKMHGDITTDNLNLVKMRSTVCLLFLNAPQRADYIMISSDIVTSLLSRFNGHFTVKECLDSMSVKWRDVSLTPLWHRLTWLHEVGLLSTYHRDSELKGIPTLGSRRTVASPAIV